ncbi:MAG: hypothetical protein V7605_737 [Acidimicrobiaceae bacterium]|jgi:hypothetical protein
MRTRVLVGAGIVVTVAVVVGLAVTLASGGGKRPAPPAPAAGRPLTIGLWGDVPYTAADQAGLPATIASMNAANLDFSVFDGDFKDDGPCEDGVYTSAIDRFNQLDAPAVYVVGDNEWTDCSGGGRTVHNERLAHLRRVMFAGPDSFGRRTMALDHQSADYPENTRWRMGDVVFVGVHVVGNNDNHADPVESGARDAADRAWLRDSFDLATRTKAVGVMVITQADPSFELVRPADRVAGQVDGLDWFLDALRQETARFAKPVALVHGDGHRYRLDHPLLDATGTPVPNLVRLETFGTPSLSWVEATVDPRDPRVFRFDIRRVG